MKKILIGLLLLSCLITINSCKKNISGCTVPSATNFNLAADIDDGSCTYHYVGESFGGGVIFYLDLTKAHGLIVAPSDQSIGIKWDNGQSTATTATGTAIGSGKINTPLIVATLGVGNYAAFLCDTLTLNGYNDWFLPSRDELFELYAQKGAGKVSGFANANYWSSTEYSYYSALMVSMLSGYDSFYYWDGSGLIDSYAYPNKSLSSERVRAIRSF